MNKQKENEIEKEIKQLMLFCKHNQEAKDRLNKISDLIQSKKLEEDSQSKQKDVLRIIDNKLMKFKQIQKELLKKLPTHKVDFKTAKWNDECDGIDFGINELEELKSSLIREK